MKRWLCIVIPVIFLGSLIFWRISQEKAEVAAQIEQRAARKDAPAVVSLAEVERRSLIETFEVTGTLEAPRDVKIAPKITGRIEMLEVEEGDRVRKGQVLVKIDSSEIEASVQQQMANVAEAKYRLAQAQLNQTPTDVAVATQIRQQQANTASAEADYKQVQENYQSELAAASASLTDAESKIENAKAAVRSAQANLKNAEARYNRILSLHSKGFIAAQEVDDAKAALAVQESAVEVAQGQLKSAIAQRDAAQQSYNIVKTKGKADIEAARAKLEQARASLDYAKANTSSKSAYRQSLAALKASVAAAEASLRSAQAKRRDTILISPLDGYVTGRYADPGAIASPSQPILSVQFTKQIWVTAAVPEEVCAKVHIGQPVKIKLDALPGRVFNAGIIQINPSADPQSKQYTVRAVLDNADGSLKPGMFAHISIETGKIDNAVVVPREAVQSDRMGSYVIISDSGQKAKRVEVVPQGEDENYICIGDALPVGAKVVVMSAMPVREGQTIVPGGEGERGRGGRPQKGNAR